MKRSLRISAAGSTCLIGLDYAVNRYYSSALGRFVTPDPYLASGGTADPGSWNRYVYAASDPVNGFDPEGLFVWVANGCLAALSRIPQVGGSAPAGMAAMCQMAQMNEGLHPAMEAVVSAVAVAIGGGGATGPTFTKGRGDLSYANLTGTGQQVTDVKNQLLLLEVNIDLDCAQWLATNLSSGLNDMIEHMTVGVFDGAKSSKTGTWVSFPIVAVANDAGYSVLINSAGGYFGAGLKNDFEVLIHEIAHLANAPGFQHDGDTDAKGNLTQAAKDAQAANAKLIESHCSKTIH